MNFPQKNSYSRITIDAKDIDIDNLKQIMEKYGVCIIENYFENPDQYVDDIFDWFTSISSTLTEDPESWSIYNTPSGPNSRFGMYKSLVGHCPTVYKLREEVYPLYTLLHNEEKLITSIDGMSFYPPTQTYMKKTKDWPHIDQFKTSDEICYQSQCVLTDTNASFVCTPGSHKLFDHIKANYESKMDWLSFDKQKIDELKQMLSEYAKEEYDELLYNWQIPIVAPKGSLILWYSNTIHSSRPQTEFDFSEKITGSRFEGWRCVVYVCQRKKENFTKRNLTTIKRCVTEGRMTNHWGKNMNPKYENFFNRDTKSDEMLNLLDDPSKIITPIENMSELTLKLTGIVEW